MEQRKIKTVVVEQGVSLHVEEPNNTIEIPKVHSPNQHNLPPQISNMVTTTLLFPLPTILKNKFHSISFFYRIRGALKDGESFGWVEGREERQERVEGERGGKGLMRK